MSVEILAAHFLIIEHIFLRATLKIRKTRPLINFLMSDNKNSSFFLHEILIDTKMKKSSLMA